VMDDNKKESLTPAKELAEPAHFNCFYNPPKIKITCCRCKAEEIEQAHDMSFLGPAADFAIEHYGTAHFGLCDKCTVEVYTGLFGVSKP
jgi:hypothetical protein